MSLRKWNKRRKVKKNKLSILGSNLMFGVLILLVVGFLISVIDRLFFNVGFDPNHKDLSKLITKTAYEKKTGHKIQVEIRNGCGIPKLAKCINFF